MNRLNLPKQNDDMAIPLRRQFTLEESNRALVLVRRVVADIVTHYARLSDLQEIIDSAQDQGALEPCETAQRELVKVAEKLQACARELDEIGVELKDWAAGVVDFPCIIDGREAYFCWRFGEDAVEFWHELDDTIACRQSVHELQTT